MHFDTIFNIRRTVFWEGGTESSNTKMDGPAQHAILFPAMTMYEKRLVIRTVRPLNNTLQQLLYMTQLLSILVYK
jgi:hypothetical protein